MNATSCTIDNELFREIHNAREDKIGIQTTRYEILKLVDIKCRTVWCVLERFLVSKLTFHMVSNPRQGHFDSKTILASFSKEDRGTRMQIPSLFFNTPSFLPAGVRVFS